MKTISIGVYNRPELLNRVLTSIAACPGHEEWTLVLSCEPGAVLPDRFPCERIISRNVVRLNLRTNLFLGHAIAYRAGSEFHLHLEDDVVLAPDALRLADAFRASGKDGILCLRRWHKTEDLTRPNAVSPANHGLLGNGFAYKRETWELIRRWWYSRDNEAVVDGWDWSVSYQLDTHNVKQWRPFVQRSQNIGLFGTNTVNGTDPNHFSPCYTGCESSFEFV